MELMDELVILFLMYEQGKVYLHLINLLGII